MHVRACGPLLSCEIKSGRFTHPFWLAMSTKILLASIKPQIALQDRQLISSFFKAAQGRVPESPTLFLAGRKSFMLKNMLQFGASPWLVSCNSKGGKKKKKKKKQKISGWPGPEALLLAINVYQNNQSNNHNSNNNNNLPLKKKSRFCNGAKKIKKGA